MNRLVNALILFMSLGFRAHGLHDRGMIYGFDKVSRVLGTTLRGSTFLTTHLD